MVGWGCGGGGLGVRGHHADLQAAGRYARRASGGEQEALHLNQPARGGAALTQEEEERLGVVGGLVCPGDREGGAGGAGRPQPPEDHHHRLPGVGREAGRPQGLLAD